MIALDRVTTLLSQCASLGAHLPPTTLYNEGWMLRLILDWCSQHPATVDEFAFLAGAHWYSEALLPSRFGGRGGPREGFTHADGVIGHFRFRPGGRGDIELAADARQLSVVEAKMGSLLSSGTSNAAFDNQAARNVACIIHMVALSDAASTLERLSFTVVAPQRRIDERAFEEYLGPTSLIDTVRARTRMFEGAYDEWFAASFTALFPYLKVEAVSWEHIIEKIHRVDSGAGAEFQEFLRLCLKHNPMSPHRPRETKVVSATPAV